MPHHESGLLALKTTDPKTLDQAVAHFLAKEPDHSVEVVRTDEGRGVWLCFGSVIAPRTNDHVDLSAFQDDRALGRLAKKLGVPIWVGFAIGGYSNHQIASAYSAQGKREWVSECDFSWADDVREEAEDPFTPPERFHQLVIDLRKSSGYGKISQEFGVDYFRVLDVEAGDALFATDKRTLDEDGFAKLAQWLRSPWKNPEGDPGDAAQAPKPPEWIAWKLANDAGARRRLAGVIRCALDHSNTPITDGCLTASAAGASCFMVLDGAPARAAGSLLLSQRFTELAAQIAGTELSVFRGVGQSAEPEHGVGAPGGAFAMVFRGGQGLDHRPSGKPMKLIASPEVREVVRVFRRPALLRGERGGEANEGAAGSKSGARGKPRPGRKARAKKPAKKVRRSMHAGRPKRKR